MIWVKSNIIITIFYIICGKVLKSKNNLPLFKWMMYTNVIIYIYIKCKLKWDIFVNKIIISCFENADLNLFTMVCYWIFFYFF